MKSFTLSLVLCVLSFLAKAQTNCDIKVSIQNGCNPLPVNYYFSSTGKATAISWLWDFGDGTTSGQKSPGHVYITPGKYLVKVTVKFNDSTQCTAYLANPIEVFSNPNVDFSVNNNQKILLCSRGKLFVLKTNQARALIRPQSGHGYGALVMGRCQPNKVLATHMEIAARIW